MKFVLTALVAAPLFIGAAGCWHATELAATWRDPTAGRAAFAHGVAIFVSKDEAIRRTVEDRMAGSFPNLTPSYRVMPQIEKENQDQILAKLRQAGFDGAFMMRVADVSVVPTYAPGNYWYDRPYGFNGYWNMAWSSPYDPYGAWAPTSIVTIETQVYSLADDKLVFAARSNTTNPSSVKMLTESVIRHVKEAMLKTGLVASRFTDRYGMESGQ
jgi:hypothetical protein